MSEGFVLHIEISYDQHARASAVATHLPFKEALPLQRRSFKRSLQTFLQAASKPYFILRKFLEGFLCNI